MECNRFEKDSVNVMKNGLLLPKNTRKFPFISTWFSHMSKPWKVSQGINNTQNVRKSYWFTANC